MDSVAEMSRELRRALQQIIESDRLEVAFQPIVDLRAAEIIGYEALCRPPAGPLQSPAELFLMAERLGLHEQLEAVARHSTFQAIRDWNPGGPLLFLNNSPPVFAADGFVDAIVESVSSMPNLDPHRVILEITERTGHDIVGVLESRSRELREHGFLIALDDVGAGISGLNRLMSLRPDWIKIDGALVADIHRDPVQQNLMRFFVHFAKLSNMQLIAECVECREDLAALIEMGVTHGQGFCLGRPAPEARPLASDVRQTILEIQRQAAARKYEDPSTVRVAMLADPVSRFDAQETCATVLEQMGAPSQPSEAVVLDGRRYLGVIERSELERSCDQGMQQATVGTLKLRETPLLGEDATLAEALEVAAAQPEELIRHPLVIQGGGEIKGVLTLRRMLLAAAEAHRRAPSHIASLTGLPGRVQADRWIADGIRSGAPDDVAFVDLRDFDAYNVAYGFEMGDVMLLKLVGLVRALVTNPCGPAAFFSHLGEDRFMVGTRTDMHESLATLIREFSVGLGEFFGPGDLERGAFACVDPAGDENMFPVTSVRVVYVAQALRRVSSPRELYGLANQLRLASRLRDPSALPGVIDDRRAQEIEQRKSA